MPWSSWSRSTERTSDHRNGRFHRGKSATMRLTRGALSSEDRRVACTAGYVETMYWSIRASPEIIEIITRTAWWSAV